MDMPPRTPLFQRKGGDSPGGKPSITIAIGHQDPKGANGGAATKESADDSTQPQDCTCPNCGCTFDPATGEVSDGDQGGSQMPPADAGGGDLSSKIASMMGGQNGQ